MSGLSDGNRLGILSMLAAMVGFALADTLIKLSSQTASGGAGPGQIIVFLGVGGLIAFGVMMLRSGERLTRDVLFDRMVILRTLGDVIAVGAMTTALTRLPVGEVSAILQVQPIVVVLGAAFFLGERVSLRRWLAVVAAFAGVMIILRPGMTAFHPAFFFVLLGVIGLSLRDLATRALHPSRSSVVVSAVANTALIPLGIAIHLVSDVPADTGVETNAILVAASVCGVVAYYAITQAMRLGEVSVIAPFRYSRIVAAFVIAYLVLGERPDIWTLVGSAIVVAAGIAALMNERRGNRERSEPPLPAADTLPSDKGSRR